MKPRLYEFSKVPPELVMRYELKDGKLVRVYPSGMSNTNPNYMKTLKFKPFVGHPRLDFPEDIAYLRGLLEAAGYTATDEMKELLNEL